MEFDDFPEKPKRSEKSKRRFFPSRRLRYRAYIVLLIGLNLFILDEFWRKPTMAKIFADTVITCTLG